MSWSPRKIEMIAGGASLAPSRWSLDADATAARNRPRYLYTERMMAPQNVRNCMFLCGGVTRVEGCPGWRAQREVDVLARPVDAGERLLVQQALPCRTSRRPSSWWSSSTAGGRGRYGALEDRGDLELAGRDLVVPGLGRDAQLEQLAVQLDHESQHPVGNGTK